MPPTHAHLSPAEDIASWQREKSVARNTLLTPDQIAFTQHGVSVTLATRGRGDQPAVGIGVGCRMHPDGTMRVLLSRRANRDLLASLESGSAIAVTFTSAADHRAFQVKAMRAAILPSTSDDVPEMDRQCAVFQDELIGLGFPPKLARGYVRFDPEQLVAIEFVPERVFTQTPGPGAGAELK